MLRFRFVFLFKILILIHLLSCQGERIYTFDPIRSFQISFPADKNEIWSISNFIHQQDSIITFTYVDRATRSIKLVSYGSSMFSDSISLSCLDSLTDFDRHNPEVYFHNLDSIFVLEDETKNIFLINGNGGLIRKINIASEDLKFNFVLSAFGRSFFFRNKRIYLRLVPIVDPEDYHRLRHSTAIALSIDVYKDDSISLIGKWPESYLSDNYYDNYPWFCSAGGNLVFSFASEHKLLECNTSKNIRFIDSKSIFIHDVPVFINDSVGNIKYTMEYLIKSPRYSKLYFDENANIYYRQALHKADITDDKTNSKRKILDKPWSLVISDVHGNLLLEKEFDYAEYSFKPIYQTQDGLLIPKRNIQNENKGHFEWIFEEFTLKEKDE